MGGIPFQPFRRTHRHGCMAGYHCLMPLASFHCEFGKTRICQRNFEFWAQIKGLRTNERVTRSKKRDFWDFFVNHWLTNGYADANLLSNGLQNLNLRELRFWCAKGKVSSCERSCLRRWNMVFGAVKAKVWRWESLAFAKWRMKNEEWRIHFNGF